MWTEWLRCTPTPRSSASWARSITSSLQRLQADERQWAQRGHGRFAVVDRETGVFLGRAGLRYWPQFAEVEVGWVLRPEVWGNGYASEAARAYLTWGFRDFDLPYVTAMVQPDNSR